MRNPQDLPRRRRRWGVPGRGRSVLIGLAVVLIVLVFSLRAIARVYTDFLWFDALGVARAWERQLQYQGILAVLFSLVFFVLLSVNLLIANRIAPAVVPRRTGDELVERYRELVGGRQRTVWLTVAVGFALIAGVGAASQWKSWALFRFGGSFGTKDPLNKVDLGFYVFKLPFLSYVVSWAFAASVIVLLLVLMAHYLTGAVHLPGTGAAASRATKTHLSALFALLALVKAADYWLDRYRLTLSNRGVVSGALYTDVNATLPATILLVLIAVLCAATFVVNIRRKGWGLPMIALGLWVLVSIVAGTVYPAALQKLKVDAKESALEAPYIKRNITATRAAMGLDRVEERNFDYQDQLSDQTITDNASTVSNVRLLDPTVIPPTFTTLQSKFDFYQFSDLDVDRYQFNGQQTEVIIGARELNQDAIPVDTWEGRHLSYTHGYGVAMAPANAVNADGEPDFAISDVPVRIDTDQVQGVKLTRPELYFGEGLDTADEAGYAIVGTSLKEEGRQYDGGGGVAIDSLVRKMAFALRFGDLEPLTSEYLTSKSRVLYIRGVRERVSQVAPFLQWDHDPYPVLIDGRIKYVIDGYTTSDSVPYAQTANVSDLDASSGLAGQKFNYLRNSVKAVVDAYDGKITMYVTDEMYGSHDPIIEAYSAAFPELFTPGEKMPAELKSHLRYPEDLFKVQTEMWGRYHLSDPGEFYKQQDGWDVAQNPPASIDRSSAAAAGEGFTPIDPNYLQMRLPKESADEFVLFRPFVPHSQVGSKSPKKQLNSFMVGRSDPERYGSLSVYTMTEPGPNGTTQRNRDVDGPLTAHENMVSNTTTRLSERLTQLEGGGSKVKFGNLVLVPIQQGLLYVRPIYVSGSAEGSAQQLRIVVVSIGGQVAIGDTLAEALTKLFPTAKIATREVTTPSTDVSTTTTPGSTPTTTAPDDNASAADLIAQAVKLFDEADAELRSGGATNLSDYQAKTAQAQELVRRAEQALGGTATTTTTTTP
ncbi:MAG: UPF0182 family protein [Acidimicrobiales bacterium]